MNLLAVDIGNTTISFGIFQGCNLLLNFKLPTHSKNNSYYKKNILKFLQQKKIRIGNIETIAVCSVVPEKERIIKTILSSIFKKRVFLIGKDIIVPIKNKYRIPKQVGQDRLVNAYAGLKLYGPGLIIIDFGTAITFDIVSKKSEYLGGLIFPGLDLSLSALYLYTALLPKVKIKKPASLIGKDTESSINNGIVYGMAGVCDSVVERLLREYKGYKIITTGGNVQFIGQFSNRIKEISPNLTLQGIRLVLSQVCSKKGKNLITEIT